jgi:AcrR family transcriptional regulator
MARRIPEHRFEELVRAATEVFIERGYRRTQMSDVAEAVGVAKGTLYGYVESKDALLALCLRVADDPGPIPVPEVLPLASPAPGSLRAQITQALKQGNRQPRLEAALERAEAEDPAEEMRGVLEELYDLILANRHRVKLLDRCADHPELGAIWQEQGREVPRAALARYLERRADAGRIPRPSNPRLAARILLETVTTWALHIHWDRAPERYDPAEARDAVIDLLVRGFTR